MSDVSGLSGVLGSNLVQERQGGRGGARPDGGAFREAMQQQGHDDDPRPDAQESMRRTLQRRASIDRREGGEARHVDVVA